jgi:hypothetical protein
MSIQTQSSTNFSTVGSSTFTIPRYVYSIVVEATGGGSGGGVAVGGKGGSSRGGGGGSSGAMISKTLSVKPGDKISYTIGAGGAASSGSGGGKGGDTEFVYKGTTYECGSGNAGADATSGGGGGNGAGGNAHTPSDGDTNTASNAGASGGTGSGGSGGASVSGDGYGAGGDGSGNHSSQNNTAGGGGGIKFIQTVDTPSKSTSSGRIPIVQSSKIGGNKIARSLDGKTGKSRIQAAVVGSSISLSATSTKFTLGGMPLTVKKASNGNYVLSVYPITDSSPTYDSGRFTKSTTASYLKGSDVDVFVSNDGKHILALDRLEDQDDIGDLSRLSSGGSDSKNAIVWLGVPFLTNENNVLLVTTSNDEAVDEFVTTYFMGSPFLVARQGTNYFLCALIDDYGVDNVEEL